MTLDDTFKQNVCDLKCIEIRCFLRAHFSCYRNEVDQGKMITYLLVHYLLDSVFAYLDTF